MTDSKSGRRVNTPCVTLYAFHLRDEIAKTPTEINANHLWEQCVALGAEDKLNIPVLRSLRTQLLCYEKDAPDGYNPGLETSDYLPLLKKSARADEDPFLRFPVASEPNAPELKGEIYPLRIHDTYGVDLSLRYLETVEIAQLRRFNLKGCLLPSNIQASLGQTLVIFADPTGGIDDYQAIADACVAAFFKDANSPKPELITAGQLFGSPIFEYDISHENPLEQCHLLVWLQGYRVWPKRRPDTLALSHQAYHYLFQLLCCRSKILYAYYQARLCNNQARRLCSQLEKKVEAFGQLKAEPENPEERTQRLERLKEWLTEIQQTGFKYAHRLRDMEDHKTAIAINSENYRYLLTEIRKLSLPDDDLKFLESFLNRICKQFQDQIQVDLRYLTPAQALFQQMIDTIRGIVEIEAEEQAQEREDYEKERDRNLQTTIAIVGVGVGFTGLTAASFPYLIPPDPKTTPIRLQPPFSSGSLHPFISVLLLSLVFGLVGAGIAKVVTMLIPPRSDKRAKLKGNADQKLLNSASTPTVEPVTGVPQKVEFPAQPPRN